MRRPSALAGRRTVLRNARGYGLEADVEYFQANSMDMPLKDQSFDGVFSNGSLHEWENPAAVFNQIYRVLRPGGAYCITDMRRDVSVPVKWLIFSMTEPKEIRPGFLTPLNVSYTIEEIEEILKRTSLKNHSVKKNSSGYAFQENDRRKARRRSGNDPTSSI